MSEYGQDYYKYGEETTSSNVNSNLIIKDEGIEKGTATSLDFKGPNITVIEEPPNSGGFSIYSQPSVPGPVQNILSGENKVIDTNVVTINALKYIIVISSVDLYKMFEVSIINKKVSIDFNVFNTIGDNIYVETDVYILSNTVNINIKNNHINPINVIFNKIIL